MITNYHQNDDFSIWIFDGLGDDPITVINQLYDVYKHAVIVHAFKHAVIMLETLYCLHTNSL